MINKKNFQRLCMVFDIVLIVIYSLIFHLSRPINTTKVVYIPKGSIGQIIAYLEHKKFLLSPTIDKYTLLFIGRPQSGWINIGQTKLSRGDFLYKLSNSKAALNEITLIPGETIDIFLYQISQKYNLSYRKLFKNYLKISPLRDGLIVPETYYIPVGIQERHLVNYLVNYAWLNYRKMSMKILENSIKKAGIDIL